MSARHIAHTNTTEELTKVEVERIFEAMRSEPARTLRELLAGSRGTAL